MFKYVIFCSLFMAVLFTLNDQPLFASSHTDTTLIAKRDRQASRVSSARNRNQDRRAVRNVKFDERSNFEKHIYRDWEHVIDPNDYYNRSIKLNAD